MRVLLEVSVVVIPPVIFLLPFQRHNDGGLSEGPIT